MSERMKVQRMKCGVWRRTQQAMGVCGGREYTKKKTEKK